MTGRDPHTERFETERRRLTGLAYRMLGSLGDAEDVVQDAWLRWRGAAGQQIERPAAWLTRTVSRLCIDRARRLKARREDYVGPWLPEPIVVEQPDDMARRFETAEAVSLALLRVLETLTPMERAAFLLHDVFDADYGEVAAALRTSPVNARQLASRARRRLAEARPRFTASEDDRRRLVERFARTVETGDLEGLAGLLSEEAVLWSDGGGLAKAARNPIRGPDRIARFLLGLAAKRPEGFTLAPAVVNGEPGFLGRLHGRPFLVMGFRVSGDRLAEIMVVLNPEKLRGVAA